MTPTREALEQDVIRRVSAAQTLMAARDIKILVAVVGGTPGRTGWMRYFAAADERVDQAFVVIEPSTVEPLILVWSRHAAEWIRSMATTSRIESTFARRVPPLQRVIEVMEEATAGRGRVGTLGMRDAIFAPGYLALRKAFPKLELIDLTSEVNAIRQVKSPFEIAAIRDMGSILAEALELFAERARPGRLLMEVAGEVEGFLKGRGCVIGRVKYSLGERPYTIPPLADQRFARDDVFVFQFVYMSPLGYWYELSSLYSFRPLPVETARRFRAMMLAMQETAKAAIPGNTYRAVSAIADQVFTRKGFKVVGKHTEDCHTIGTDIRDGANITPADWTFQQNMVLALHPASLLEGDLGFFLIDTFLVQPGGAIPLSPLRDFHRQLEVS